MKFDLKTVALIYKILKVETLGHHKYSLQEQILACDLLEKLENIQIEMEKMTE